MRKSKSKELKQIQSQVSDLTKQLENLAISLDNIIESEEQDTGSEDEIAVDEIASNSNSVVAKSSKVKSLSKERASNVTKNLGPPFSVGEKVVVANNYKGQRGTIGTVTGHSRFNKYTYIEDENGEVLRKENHNLRRLT